MKISHLIYLRSMSSWIFLSMLVFLPSCGTDTREEYDHVFDEENLIIGDYKDLTQLNFTDVYKTLRVIPLETHADGVMGKINKVIFNEDHFVVLDNKNTVFIFNARGDYINKIYIKGRGPFEATSIFDITFSSNDTSFYLLDNQSNKILTSDYTGKIIGRIDNPLKRAFSIGLTPQNDLLVFSPLSAERQKNGNLNLTNRFSFLSPNNGEVLKSQAYTISDEIPTIIQGARLSGKGEYFSIKPPFSDTIYSIDENKNFVPSHLIRAPGKKISHENDYRMTFEVLEKSKHLSYKYHQENEGYIFLVYQYKSRLYKVVIDKKSGLYYNLDYIDNTEDYIVNVSGLTFEEGSEILRFFPNGGTLYNGQDNRDLMFISAEHFLLYKNKIQDKFPSYFDIPTPERLGELTEASNQVLLIASY